MRKASSGVTTWKAIMNAAPTTAAPVRSRRSPGTRPRATTT